NDVLKRVNRDISRMQILEQKNKRLTSGDSAQRTGKHFIYIGAVFEFPGFNRGHKFRTGRRRGAKVIELSQNRKERNQIRGQVGKILRRAGGSNLPKIFLNQIAKTLIWKCAILFHKTSMEDSNFSSF